MFYLPGVRLEVSGVTLCRSVGVRAVPSRTAEPAGWVTTAERRIRWPRWHRWPRSGEAPSPLRSYSGSFRLLLSVPVRGSLSALGSTSRRVANANCGPMSGVATCRLCWLREHTTAAAWGGWRRRGAGGGEKKVCQAACSQWACMDALVQTRSYRSATPLPVSGLNKILSRRKCHDLERLLQSHSTFRTTAVRQGLTSSGALVITTHLTGCGSTVSAKQKGMKQPRSHVKGANRSKLYFPSSATGESLLWVWVQNYKHQSLWSGK